MCLVAFGCSVERPAAPDTRPDLILITVDTLRADHVGPWRGWLAGASGPVVVDTPAMDAFAADSLVFREAFSAVPITTASLGSMLTGRLPRHHGALNNTDDLDPSVPTVTMALRESGYETAAFLPSLLANKDGFRRGFETYVFPERADEFWAGEEVVRRALDFLDSRGAARQAKPLFLWVHLLDPHSPYDPGEELEAKYLAGIEHPAKLPERLRHEFIAGAPAPSARDLDVIRALYRGDVERTDRALAPLLTRIEKTLVGERESYTLFTADHGELLGEHEGYVGHTGWLYEEMLRVPFWVHSSRGRDAGEVWDYPAFGTDVGPTLLALADDDFLDAEVARILATGDGALPLLDPEVRVHLRRLKTEGKSERIRQRMLVSESFAPEGFFDQRAARLGGVKWIVGTAAERPTARFDLDADPREGEDLSSSLMGTVDAFGLLEGLLKNWEEKHGAVGDATRFEVPVDAASRDALDKLGYGGGR